MLGGVLALFLIAPLIALAANVSWRQTASVLRDPNTQSAVATSLVSTTTATCLVVVFGVPLAYVLARYSFPGKVVLTAIVYMPLVLPPIVGGILLLLVWGQYGSVGQFLEPHGVLFVGQISGIILAQVFVSSPFVIVAARSAFERIDRDLEEAARTMGADTLRYFLSIALPIALRAILAGAALSWMRSFGEFGATVILAYHPYSFPVYTWVQFQQYGIGPVLPMALLSLILGAAALVAVAILERVGVFAAIIGRVSNSPRNPMHSYPAVGPD